MSTDGFDDSESLGVGAGFDIGALLGQVQAMQEQMAEAQEKASATVLEGSAAGGKVRVTVTGTGEFTGVTIDPSVVDPAEVDLLEDLVLAALHDAAVRVAQLNAQSIGGLTSGLTSGLGLGNLFGP